MQCRGKTARMAAVYHFKLCRAILVGFRRQLQRDGNCKDGFIGIHEAEMEADPMLTYLLKDTDGEVMKVQIEDSPVYRDDIIG